MVILPILSMETLKDNKFDVNSISKIDQSLKPNNIKNNMQHKCNSVFICEDNIVIGNMQTNYLNELQINTQIFYNGLECLNRVK